VNAITTTPPRAVQKWTDLAGAEDRLVIARARHAGSLPRGQR